jgi:hypothetical protein
MVTREKIEESLAFLGTSSADQVAASLRNMGIKGSSESNSCPIANWLGGRHPTAFFNVTLVFGVRAYDCREDNTYPSLKIELPEAVYNFVGAFDMGWYDFLRV